ncbi:MAG: YlmC/YmxH family sporulation protein [Defluviitaleaceae bacterium]|nr:YlmC/YmxH family sporulation protein [Defluviitaleaceae bacterium]
MRVYELRQKEVINIKDGARFGYICDLIIDCERGKIKFIIVPGPGKIFGFFGRETEYKIPWDEIVQIGEDIILVDVETKKILIEL